MVLMVFTGAASGFGLATTLRFVAEGAKVIAADMAEEKLRKEYADQKETHVIAVVANVTSSADWKKLVDTAIDKFGGLDILVREPQAMGHPRSPLTPLPDQQRGNILPKQINA